MKCVTACVIVLIAATSASAQLMLGIDIKRDARLEQMARTYQYPILEIRANQMGGASYFYYPINPASPRAVKIRPP